MRLIRLFLISLLAGSGHVIASSAAELLMYEQEGCVWCARFNEEIAPAYPKTEEGRKAPLRRIDIHEPLPEDIAHIPVERFTPTFVLIENRNEIGRIRGYPGDEFFWVLLDELLEQAENPPDPGNGG